jgi:hypothetical protein
VFEDRRHTKHPLLDGDEATGVDPARDRRRAETDVEELLAGHPVVLPSSQPGDLSVPHMSLSEQSRTFGG